MANIVLAHGILGFSGIGLGDFEVVRYFRGVKSALEKDGHNVLAPSVNPVGTIAERAEQMAQAIMQYFSGDSDPRVIILAHSMGGLDARKALSAYSQLASITDALVTIGTPHKGSPVAQMVAQNWRPTQFIYQHLVDFLGSTVGGLSDLTPENAQIFDQETAEASGVRYFSVAGVIGPYSSLFFRALSELIPGTSDGVVPYESAHKTSEGWVALEDWPVDHAGQIGWFDLLTPEGIFNEHLQRYLNLVAQLIQSRSP